MKSPWAFSSPLVQGPDAQAQLSDLGSHPDSARQLHLTCKMGSNSNPPQHGCTPLLPVHWWMCFSTLQVTKLILREGKPQACPPSFLAV